MKKRNRNIPVMFWVTPEEHSLIEQKMAQLGTENMSAYLRKIAIDGFFNTSISVIPPDRRTPISIGRIS